MITHAPYWPTLTEQVKLADATPVLVRTYAGGRLRDSRAQPILDAITPRTRGIIINSPCNPTGALISEDELAAIAEVAARQGIWVVVDLCYEKLIYDAGRRTTCRACWPSTAATWRCSAARRRRRTR